MNLSSSKYDPKVGHTKIAYHSTKVADWSRIDKTTDNGHPERAFFKKFETFGLGQTNWAEILRGIWGISGQTISTILTL